MRRAAIIVAATAAFAGGALALAQGDIFDPQAIAAREREQLIDAKQQSAQAMARSALLEKQAAAASSEADRLKKRSAALAARIQSAEADISAGEARVALVSRRLSAQRAQLEADRALGLGEKARDIVELMDSLEADGAVRAQLAELAGPIPRPRNPEASVTGSVAPPATAEAELTRGAYRLPVVGRIVAGLGEVNESGVRSRGITIAARPGGQVVAPAPGRVGFAGDYRGYGKIVIIDHGGGWVSLLTGMIALSVGVGDTVDAGAPVGRAGSDDSRITVELRRAGRPVDVVAMIG